MATINNSSNFNNDSQMNSVKSSSNVAVSSSKSAASAALSKSNNVPESNSSVSTKAKAEPKVIKPLSERTSKHDVNNRVRDIKITDKKGNVITAALMAPSYKDALTISDNRQEFNMMNRTMKLTTPRFYSHLFPIVRNLEVNQKPFGQMSWHFADEYLEAFNWIMRMANSFLTDKFNAD